MSHQATTSVGNYQDVQKAFAEMHAAAQAMAKHRYRNADGTTLQAYLTVFRRKCAIFSTVSRKQEYLDAPGYQPFLRSLFNEPAHEHVSHAFRYFRPPRAQYLDNLELELEWDDEILPASALPRPKDFFFLDPTLPRASGSNERDTDAGRQPDAVERRVRVEEMDVESIPATRKGKGKDMGLGMDVDVVRPVVEGPRDVRIQEEKEVVKAEEIPKVSRTRKRTIKSAAYIEESDEEDELAMSTPDQPPPAKRAKSIAKDLPAAPPKLKKVAKGKASKSARAGRKVPLPEAKPTAVASAPVDDREVSEPTRKLREYPPPEPQVGLYWVNVENVVVGGSCRRCKERGFRCLVCYEKPYDLPQHAPKKLSDKRQRPYKKVACHQCNKHKDKCEWGAAFTPSIVAGKGNSEAPPAELEEQQQAALAAAAANSSIQVCPPLPTRTGNAAAGPSRTSRSRTATTITLPPPRDHPHIATIQEDPETPPRLSAVMKPPPLTPIELPPIKLNAQRTPPEHKLGGRMTTSKHMPVREIHTPVPSYASSSTTSDTPFGSPPLSLEVLSRRIGEIQSQQSAMRASTVTHAMFDDEVEKMMDRFTKVELMETRVPQVLDRLLNSRLRDIVSTHDLERRLVERFEEHKMEVDRSVDEKIAQSIVAAEVDVYRNVDENLATSIGAVEDRLGARIDEVRNEKEALSAGLDRLREELHRIDAGWRAHGVEVDERLGGVWKEQSVANDGLTTTQRDLKAVEGTVEYMKGAYVDVRLGNQLAEHIRTLQESHKASLDQHKKHMDTHEASLAEHRRHMETLYSHVASQNSVLLHAVGDALAGTLPKHLPLAQVIPPASSRRVVSTASSTVPPEHSHSPFMRRVSPLPRRAVSSPAFIDPRLLAVDPHAPSTPSPRIQVIAPTPTGSQQSQGDVPDAGECAGGSPLFAAPAEQPSSPPSGGLTGSQEAFHQYIDASQLDGPSGLTQYHSDDDMDARDA
ncbi:hypothetical protein BDZ97DRAFT_1930931 [Flammula alnicola]|nr:hypothetical protein BDZ97DRAFT_1930931 [Flammula alnicola]